MAELSERQVVPREKSCKTLENCLPPAFEKAEAAKFLETNLVQWNGLGVHHYHPCNCPSGIVPHSIIRFGFSKQRVQPTKDVIIVSKIDVRKKLHGHSKKLCCAASKEQCTHVRWGVHGRGWAEAYLGPAQH